MVCVARPRQELYHTRVNSLEAGGGALGLRPANRDGTNVAAFSVRPHQGSSEPTAEFTHDRQLLIILFGIIREFNLDALCGLYVLNPYSDDFDCSEWLMLEVRPLRGHVIVPTFISNDAVTDAASGVRPRHNSPSGRS